jgi:predicted acylesterase/phospholipase RssA
VAAVFWLNAGNAAPRVPWAGAVASIAGVGARLCLHRLAPLAVAALLAGCAVLEERVALPIELTEQVGIPGVPNARFWGDKLPEFTVRRLKNTGDAEIRASFAGIYGKPHHYLAISGGGANGAYGAGLLAGWTKSGKRPEFTMVTGVSTGALTAPFAFLGSDYDDVLKSIYTETHTSDILVRRNILDAIFTDAVTGTQPLRKLIEKFITDDLVDAIAVEHRAGRRLFIGTANLDAGRSMIWNLGAIAASTYPRKQALIHDVLQASSAIPVAFPPVLIPVYANGQRYEEMHVDGGTASQVFVYPAAVDWRRITRMLKVPGKPKVYVIRNSFLEPDHRQVKRNLLSIAGRTIDSLIRTQGIGDLYQIYSLCERDGNDFNLAYIPADFDLHPKEAFDPVYMSALFELGFGKGRAGYQWTKEPPGFANPR